MFRGEHQRSLDMAWRSLAVAKRIGAPDVLAQAHLMVGNALFWVGELRAAEEHLSRLLQSRDHDAHLAGFAQDPRFTAVFPAALGRWLLGDPAGARRMARAALDEAIAAEHAFSEATVLQVLGFIHCLDGDAAAAHEIGGRLVALAREHAYPVYVGIGSMQLGWAQARLGQLEGLQLMLDTLARMRAAGTRVGGTLMGFLIADAHRAAGRAQVALAVAEEALADARARRELAFAGLLEPLVATPTRETIS